MRDSSGPNSRHKLTILAVHKYNQLMKDFPLDELLAATDLEKIQDSLFQIFGHITKKLRISPYPIRRALPLVEAISRDFADALLKVLGSHQLMYMEYASFERTMAAASAAFTTWDEQIKDFTNVAREVTRRRSEKFIAIKINPAHAPLKERCEYLRQFRKQHEQLRVMTGRDKGISAMGATVKASGISDIDMEDEVRAAYESVKNVDVLDTSLGASYAFSLRRRPPEARGGRRRHRDLGHGRDGVQREGVPCREPDHRPAPRPPRPRAQRERDVQSLFQIQRPLHPTQDPRRRARVSDPGRYRRA